MDKTIINSLELLGLTSKEVKFFQSCFILGSCTINEAAKEAKLERSTAYLIAKSLIRKGLMEEDFKQYKKKINVIEPKILLRLIAGKQRQLRRQEIELEENLPQLQSLYSTSSIRPHVRVFEGNKGLILVWEDILSTKGEILLWTNQETENLFFTEKLHQRFIEERVKKQLNIQVLAVNNEQGQQLIFDDGKFRRKTKLLPLNVNFSAETYIYDHKVAILDYNKDIIGVIIESEPIANSQRAIFEMSWMNLI